MNRKLQDQKSWLKSAALVVAIGFFYFCAAQLGFEFAYEQSHATPVWPPSGLALAALLLLGWRVWPGIWLGAFAANAIFLIQSVGAPVSTAIWVSAAIAIGNTLEALAGWWLWQRWLGPFNRHKQKACFVERRDVFQFASIALLMCVPSTCIGPVAIYAAGIAPWSKFSLTWAIWWIGDASAVMLLTPFLLAWARPVKIRWNLPSALEGIAAFGALVVSIWAVFGGWHLARPLPYLTLVPLVWIAVRQGPRAASSALVLLTTCAIWLTVHGEGPFTFPSEQQAILLLQAYLWVAALTIMVLASSVAALKKLSNVLEEQVQERTAELFKSNAALLIESREAARFASIVESSDDAIMGQDFLGIVTSWNAGAEKLFGYQASEMIGHSISRIFPMDQQSEEAKILGQIQGGASVWRYEAVRVRKDGSKVDVSITLSPIRDANRKVIGASRIARDITRRKQAESKAAEALQREVILRREINHRVKNNLQVISSLLYLQATKSDDPKVCDVLRESQLRVQSLSVIYDKLGQHGAVTDIGFAEYVQQMATGLFTAYGVRQETIELKTSVEEIFLDLDTAVPCGLILTELITNALKYAFPEKRKGEVLIDLRSMVDGSLCLTVSDNGVGLPEGFKLGMAKSMGMGLVRDLTRQLNGQIAFHNHHGTTATVVFPVPKS